MTEFIAGVSNEDTLAVLKAAALGLHTHINGNGRELLIDDVGEYEAELQIKGYKIAIMALVNTAKAVRSMIVEPVENKAPPVDPVQVALADLFYEDN